MSDLERKIDEDVAVCVESMNVGQLKQRHHWAFVYPR